MCFILMTVDKSQKLARKIAKSARNFPKRFVRSMNELSNRSYLVMPIFFKKLCKEFKTRGARDMSTAADETELCLGFSTLRISSDSIGRVHIHIA